MPGGVPNTGGGGVSSSSSDKISAVGGGGGSTDFMLSARGSIAGADGFDLDLNPGAGRGGVNCFGEGELSDGRFAAEPIPGWSVFETGGSSSDSSTMVASGTGSSSHAGAEGSNRDSPTESMSAGPGIRTRPPHFPQRAFFPARSSGALSFTPQAGHETSMGMEAPARKGRARSSNRRASRDSAYPSQARDAIVRRQRFWPGSGKWYHSCRTCPPPEYDFPVVARRRPA